MQRIAQEPDYIALKRYNNSLSELKVRYPEVCPDHIIANALLVKESQVEDLYRSAIEHLRELMGATSYDGQ